VKRNTDKKSQMTGAAEVPQIPKSVTSLWINFFGVFCFFLCMYYLPGNGDNSTMSATAKALFVIASYAIPVAILEMLLLKTHLKTSTGYNFSHAQQLPWINFFGVLLLLGGIYVSNTQLSVDQSSPFIRLLVIAMQVVVLYVIPVKILELTLVKNSPDHNRAQTSTSRVVTKLLGFYLTLFTVGVMYWLLSEYGGGPYSYLVQREQYSGFYLQFWQFLDAVVPVLVVLAVPYFFIMDRYTARHEDGNWQMGMFVIIPMITLYTALLGGAISSDKNGAHPRGRIPAIVAVAGIFLITGIVPAVFLGWIVHAFVMRSNGSLRAGLVANLNGRELDKAHLSQHALGWMVKGFFLPLMYSYMNNTVNYFTNLELGGILTYDGRFQWFNFGWEVIYGIDLIIVTVGYCMTFRILDSHIRSAEPTATGWWWAIICYQPFWTQIYANYLKYDDDGMSWTVITQGNEPLYWFFAISILLLSAVYTLASIGFGLRFSNLTNRGIITNGAYRWTKHPAYVSKNLSWWFIAIPFVVHAGSTPLNAIRDSILLLGLNMVYYIRARTEERHLSSDPAYVQYALAMNEKSMFSWVGKMFPPMRYKQGPKLVDLE
jgi:protein-S-isoprenylcysteine O-methyltransferase Ste14